MNPVEAILSVGDELAAERAAFVQEKADHERTSGLLDAALGREAELQARLDESLSADLLDRYRKVCVERDVLQRRVKSRRITNSDDLDNMPVGSIVRDGNGDALQCRKRLGAWFHGAGDTFQFSSDEVPLPVLVLWLPGWGA